MLFRIFSNWWKCYQCSWQNSPKGLTDRTMLSINNQRWCRNKPIQFCNWLRLFDSSSFLDVISISAVLNWKWCHKGLTCKHLCFCIVSLLASHISSSVFLNFKRLLLDITTMLKVIFLTFVVLFFHMYSLMKCEFIEFCNYLQNFRPVLPDSKREHQILLRPIVRNSADKYIYMCSCIFSLEEKRQKVTTFSEFFDMASKIHRIVSLVLHLYFSDCVFCFNHFPFFVKQRSLLKDETVVGFS